MAGRKGRKAPRGVGERIFQEVEKLTAGGKMNRLGAFKSIASRTGKKVGTVTANYYRIARKRGVPLRARRSGGAGGAAAKGGAGSVITALRRLEAVLHAQEAELTALRKENQRFAKLRRLLKG